jgi:hypothetical protein
MSRRAAISRSATSKLPDPEAVDFSMLLESRERVESLLEWMVTRPMEQKEVDPFRS